MPNRKAKTSKVLVTSVLKVPVFLYKFLVCLTVVMFLPMRWLLGPHHVIIDIVFTHFNKLALMQHLRAFEKSLEEESWKRYLVWQFNRLIMMTLGHNNQMDIKEIRTFEERKRILAQCGYKGVVILRKKTAYILLNVPATSNEEVQRKTVNKKFDEIDQDRTEDLNDDQKLHVFFEVMSYMRLQKTSNDDVIHIDDVFNEITKFQDKRKLMLKTKQLNYTTKQLNKIFPYTNIFECNEMKDDDQDYNASDTSVCSETYHFGTETRDNPYLVAENFANELMQQELLGSDLQNDQNKKHKKKKKKKKKVNGGDAEIHEEEDEEEIEPQCSNNKTQNKIQEKEITNKKQSETNPQNDKETTKTNDKKNKNKSEPEITPEIFEARMFQLYEMMKTRNREEEVERAKLIEEQKPEEAKQALNSLAMIEDEEVIDLSNIGFEPIHLEIGMSLGMTLKELLMARGILVSDDIKVEMKSGTVMTMRRCDPSKEVDPSKDGDQKCNPSKGGNQRCDPSKGGDQRCDPSKGGDQRCDPSKEGDWKSDPSKGGDKQIPATLPKKKNKKTTKSSDGDDFRARYRRMLDEDEKQQKIAEYDKSVEQATESKRSRVITNLFQQFILKYLGRVVERLSKETKFQNFPPIGEIAKKFNFREILKVYKIFQRLCKEDFKRKFPELNWNGVNKFVIEEQSRLFYGCDAYRPTPHKNELHKHFSETYEDHLHIALLMQVKKYYIDKNINIDSKDDEPKDPLLYIYHSNPFPKTSQPQQPSKLNKSKSNQEISSKKTTTETSTKSASKKIVKSSTIPDIAQKSTSSTETKISKLNENKTSIDKKAEEVFKLYKKLEATSNHATDKLSKTSCKPEKVSQSNEKSSAKVPEKSVSKSNKNQSLNCKIPDDQVKSNTTLDNDKKIKVSKQPEVSEKLKSAPETVTADHKPLQEKEKISDAKLVASASQESSKKQISSSNHLDKTSQIFSWTRPKQQSIDKEQISTVLEKVFEKFKKAQKEIKEAKYCPRAETQDKSESVDEEQNSAEKNLVSLEKTKLVDQNENCEEESPKKPCEAEKEKQLPETSCDTKLSSSEIIKESNVAEKLEVVSTFGQEEVPEKVLPTDNVKTNGSALHDETSKVVENSQEPVESSIFTKISIKEKSKVVENSQTSAPQEVSPPSFFTAIPLQQTTPDESTSNEGSNPTYHHSDTTSTYSEAFNQPCISEEVKYEASPQKQNPFQIESSEVATKSSTNLQMMFKTIDTSGLSPEALKLVGMPPPSQHLGAKRPPGFSAFTKPPGLNKPSPGELTNRMEPPGFNVQPTSTDCMNPPEVVEHTSRICKVSPFSIPSTSNVDLPQSVRSTQYKGVAQPLSNGTAQPTQSSSATQSTLPNGVLATLESNGVQQPSSDGTSTQPSTTTQIGHTQIGADTSGRSSSNSSLKSDQTATNNNIKSKKDKISQERKNDAKVFANMGQQDATAKDFLKAIQNFTKAIGLDYTNHSYYKIRSICYERNGNFHEALEDIEAILKLKPTYIKGIFRKACILKSLKRYIEADEVLRNVINQNPTFTDASNELSHVRTLQLMEIGIEETKAKQIVDGIVDKNSDFQSVVNRLKDEKLQEQKKNESDIPLVSPFDTNNTASIPHQQLNDQQAYLMGQQRKMEEQKRLKYQRQKEQLEEQERLRLLHEQEERQRREQEYLMEQQRKMEEQKRLKYQRQKEQLEEQERLKLLQEQESKERQQQQKQNDSNLNSVEDCAEGNSWVNQIEGNMINISSPEKQQNHNQQISDDFSYGLDGEPLVQSQIRPNDNNNKTAWNNNNYRNNNRQYEPAPRYVRHKQQQQQQQLTTNGLRKYQTDCFYWITSGCTKEEGTCQFLHIPQRRGCRKGEQGLKRTKFLYPNQQPH